MTKANKRKLATAALAVVATVVMHATSGNPWTLQGIQDTLMGVTPVVKTVATYPSEGTAEVHFIDIGQGSAILIKGSEKNVLIDAGESQHAPTVINYLAENGVAHLDYMINTHPHFDHMGGMVQVMEAVTADVVIMTPLKESAIPTTTSYKNLLTYLEKNKDTITTQQAVVGDSYYLGNGLELNILGPVDLYDGLNDASIVSRLDFGETFFLFCGDIENKAQQDLVDAGVLSAVNVIEAPHHGSSSSLNEAFFRAISPQVAVIQCALDNDYGHPHTETLALYEQLDITAYRNDTQGNVKIITDGTTLDISTSK